MPNKMLIDATHPEETRVVVVRGNRVEEFDFETAQRKQLRGNIYLAKVTRVEPSLQAAFVEYGGNRHGFLAFSEIHPDYYQIPVADRQALIEAEERAHREAEEESEVRHENRHGRRRSRHRSQRRRGHGERIQSEVVEPREAEASATEPQERAADRHEGVPTLPEHGYDETGTPPSAPEVIEAARAEDPHRLETPHDPAQDIQDIYEQAAQEAAQQAREAAAEEETKTEVTASPAAVAPGLREATEVAEVGDHTTAAIEPLEPAATGTFLPAELSSATAVADELPSAGAAVEPLSVSDAVDPASVPEADAQLSASDVARQLSGVQSPSVADARPGADDEAHDEDEDEDEAEDGEEAEEDVVESVGGDDVLEEVPERLFRPRRQYKIQEVIKRRQVMLVQVVKEERGNKGAALTTYLSLAGRYAVLMPNTARGGGISRKITSAQDRSRLKEVVQDLDVPEGMGIILRTAGASRSPQEIKRDFEYLIRLWETVRDTTLKSQAPTLVYEEGSLIKRSLRDLYNKEIDEILVAGEAGYREAHDFMKMLMPSNVKVVKQYSDGQPLFSRMGVESQLDAMFSPVVQLRSGGYVVINQTEALVSIDVNSGRATREHHIEDTALKTNLEAAEEVARQLRLRDLAGLIVIDFIDMDEKRNNRAVERKLSDCLRQDRARIQVGRISHFGLLEMSRQRIRASVLESSTEPCPQCGGTGHVRSVSSVALQLLRGLEETLMKGATHDLVVRTRTDVALYVLNHKRSHLRDLESSFKVTLSIIADATVSGQQSYVMDRGEQVHTLEAAKALLAAQTAPVSPAAEEPFDEEEPFDIESESELETEESEGLSEEAAEGETRQEGARRKRRRRRRSRGEAREGGSSAAAPRDDQAAGPSEQDASSDDKADESEADEEDAEEQPGMARAEHGNGERRPRRRGRRGGRRRRADSGEEGLPGSIADELGPPPAFEATSAVADFDGNPRPPNVPEAQPESPQPVSESGTLASEPVEPAPEPVAPAEPGMTWVSEPAEEPRPEREAVEHDTEKPVRRSTVREKAVVFLEDTTAQEERSARTVPEPNDINGNREPVPAEAEPAAGPSPEAAEIQRPRRAGWWSRRFGGSQ